MRSDARPDSCSRRICDRLLAERLSPDLIGLLARCRERPVAIALGLQQVRAAALLGFVELPGLLGPLVGEHLIELGARRRELHLVGRALLRVLRSQLVELAILALALGARLLEPGAKVFARLLGQVLVGRERLAPLARLRDLALEAEESLVEIRFRALQGEPPVLRLDDLLVLPGELLLEGEDLLVLLVESLAQVEKLATRDAARPGAGRQAHLELLDLAREPLGLARLDAKLLDLLPRVLDLALVRAEALLGPSQLLASLVELDGVDARQHRSRPDAVRARRGDRRAQRTRCHRRAPGRRRRFMRRVRRLRGHRSFGRDATRCASTGIGPTVAASGPVIRPNADSANASTSASTFSSLRPDASAASAEETTTVCELSSSSST